MNDTNNKILKDHNPSAGSDSLKLLIDEQHGEDLFSYQNLVDSIKNLCRADVLSKSLFKKKSLDYDSLTKYDGIVIISPADKWQEADIVTLKKYVQSNGGFLLILHDGRRTERINQLLSGYGLSVTDVKMKEARLEKADFAESPLLENIDSLLMGDVFGNHSTTITGTTSGDVLLKYKENIIGISCHYGEGKVVLLSCLPMFGNKQIKGRGNEQLLLNILKLVTPESKGHTLRAIAKEEVPVQRKWDELVKLGEKAEDFVIECLNDPDATADAAKALEIIGSAKATRPLIDSLRNKVDKPNMSLDDIALYKNLMPITAQALAAIHKNNAEALTKVLRETAFMLSDGVAIIQALCEIGDRRASRAVLEWILEHTDIACLVGVDAPILPISPSQFIIWCLPEGSLNRLMGDYTNPVLGVYYWELLFDETTKQPTGKMNLSRCYDSIEFLCKIKSPISSNILLKVAQTDNLEISVHGGGGEPLTTEYVDFSQGKKMALDELKRRGKPKYDAKIYSSEDAWIIRGQSFSIGQNPQFL